jgi:hypothetical protein
MLVIAWVGSASGAAIGLYTDSSRTTCSATLAAGEMLSIQVWIEPDAPFDSGEFRIAGLPSEWPRTYYPLDPLPFLLMWDLTGDGLQFGGGVAQPGRFGLLTLRVQATSEEHDVVLQVLPHTNPDPPPGTPAGCAWLHYGGYDDPSPGVCVRGGRFTINGTGDCFVAVEPATWSQVRRLYR